MSQIEARYILDKQTLAEMDAEFRAGAYDSISVPHIPVLDPATDPFQMNYEWLEPVSDVAEILPTCLQADPQSRLKQAAHQMRSIATGGLLAGGTDQDIFVEWVNGAFMAQCSADGADHILEGFRQKRDVTAEVVESIIGILDKRPRFSTFSIEDKVNIAIAILDSIQ